MPLGSTLTFLKKPVSVQPKPWKEIITSKVCIGIFVGHFANNWGKPGLQCPPVLAIQADADFQPEGNYLFVTQLPSFMKDVLKFDIKSVGFWT